MPGIKVVYRKPTKSVDGFGVEAVMCPGAYELVGYGHGETPKEARKAAYRNLMVTCVKAGGLDFSEFSSIDTAVEWLESR